jgi:transposase
METYSTDFRERLLRAIDGGLSQAEAARRFGVGASTIKRWKRRRARGRLAPSPRPGRPPRIGPGQLPALEAQLRAAADASLAEHCATWERTHGVRVSAATMSRALRRLGWTVKKRS